MSVVEQLELALETDSPDEPDSPPLDYEETRRLVFDLHPRGVLSEGGRDTLRCYNSPDFFLPDRSKPASIDIDIADVRKAINYANRSSGRGVSGWTFALVKQLMNYGTEQQQERLLQALKQWAELVSALVSITHGALGTIHHDNVEDHSDCKAGRGPSPHWNTGDLVANFP